MKKKAADCKRNTKITTEATDVSSPAIRIVDFRDSFVHTIAGYLGSYGAGVTLERAEDTDLDAVEADRPDGILLSPGPGHPSAAAVGHRVLERFAGRIPVLGVCLGHQIIAEHWGAVVDRAPELRHGETSEVYHDGGGVFRGLSNPTTAARYHSLTVDPAGVVAPLVISASTAGGTVMGLRHRSLAVEGVQFHPESILTDEGHRLLRNWAASL
ncbi:anthranilate synthase component II [Salininema proteolyticum]|uniref:Anthranilate synthase component II n=1 Tax=Salininema proteolyticum TaxID=1607685 RepID=A0ABV8U2C2_9ACTN